MTFMVDYSLKTNCLFAQGLYRLDAARQRFIPHAPTADRENSSAGVE